MILCHDVIWLSKSSSTYCMRERGHAGKHNIENCEPEQLCEDEGCPHHGIPHVCVENKNG